MSLTLIHAELCRVFHRFFLWVPKHTTFSVRYKLCFGRLQACPHARSLEFLHGGAGTLRGRRCLQLESVHLCNHKVVRCDVINNPTHLLSDNPHEGLIFIN